MSTTTHTHKKTAEAPPRVSYTFEQFQKSGRDSDDVCAELGVGPIGPGRIYNGDLYLEKVGGGWHAWIGMRRGRLSKDRAEPERQLYEYGVEFGVFAPAS